MLKIRYLCFERSDVLDELLREGWTVVSDPKVLLDPLVRKNIASGQRVLAGPIHVTNIALLAQAEAGHPRGVHFWVEGSDFNEAAVGRAFTAATYLEECAANRDTAIVAVFRQLTGCYRELFDADLIGWVPEVIENRRRTDLVDLTIAAELHRRCWTPGSPVGEVFREEHCGPYADAVNERLELFGLTPDFTVEEFLARWSVAPEQVAEDERLQAARGRE